MNIPFKISISALASALCVTLSSCSDHYAYSGSIGVGYSNYDGLYDSSGWPIFGYYGGRPVYGYNAYGSPIFSFTLINSRCYVPSWRPAPYYRGRYHYPSHIHRVSSLPHGSHGWKQPSFDHNRPSIVNRPQHRPDNINRPQHRPDGNSFTSGRNPHQPGRPSFNNPGRPSPSADRPSSGDSRPSRPSAGSDRPSRPSSNEPSRRPSPSFGSDRPSHPARPSADSPGRPSFGGGSPSASRPSSSPRPSFGGGSPSRPSMNNSPRPSFGGGSGSRPSRPSGGSGHSRRG